MEHGNKASLSQGTIDDESKALKIKARRHKWITTEPDVEEKEQQMWKLKEGSGKESETVEERPL